MKLESSIRSGYFEGRYPWSVQGNGLKSLIILDGLRTENTAPQGLALQGLVDTYKPLSLGRTIWTLGRRQNLPEGITIPEIADDLARALEELTREPRVVMGMGLGGAIALELAARHPQLVRGLVLISSGPRLSEFGRSLYRRLFQLAQRRRWGSVHALLSGVLFRSRVSGFLGGLIARLFAQDLGSPLDPWDFMVVLLAELAWDGREAVAAVRCPTLVLHGSADVLYDAKVVQAAWNQHPSALCEIWQGLPHGLLKVDRDRVLDRVREFLLQVEPDVAPLGL